MALCLPPQNTAHTVYHPLCGVTPAHICPVSPGSCLLVPVHLRHSNVGLEEGGGRREKREGGRREGGRREERGRSGREKRGREGKGEGEREGEVKYMSLKGKIKLSYQLSSGVFNFFSSLLTPSSLLYSSLCFSFSPSSLLVSPLISNPSSWNHGKYCPIS